MKKYFIGLAIVMGTILAGATFANSPRYDGAKNLVLEKKNTVALRMPVTGGTVNTLQQQVLALSSKLPKGEPIYLFLDTPGGSIAAGEEFITFTKGIQAEIKTVTSFAASMGYIFVQSLGERLVLPTGTLMSHRAFFGMEGQVPGEFNTRLQYWTSRIESIEAAVSTRVGLEVTPYRALIKDEYWVGGTEAVKAKHADRTVTVSCAADLSGTYNEAVQTFFGPVNVIWSSCPLITTPVGVGFDNLDTTYSTMGEIESFKRAFLRVVMNKRGTFQNSADMNTFNQYVR